jgi:hypothetical protein
MMEVDRVCREYNIDEERRRELIRVVEACVEEYAKHNLLGRCSFSLKVDDDGEVALVGSPLPGYEDLNDGVDPLDAFARDIMRRSGCSREEAELAMENMQLYQNDGRIHLVSDPSKNNDTFGYILHKKDK